MNHETQGRMPDKQINRLRYGMLVVRKGGQNNDGVTPDVSKPDTQTDRGNIPRYFVALTNIT